MSHDAAHAIARRLVGDLAASDPTHYILSAQADRRGRIFLDDLHNGRGTTAIRTYSPRGRRGFPIAARMSWKQIEAGTAPDSCPWSIPFASGATPQADPVEIASKEP